MNNNLEPAVNFQIDWPEPRDNLEAPDEYKVVGSGRPGHLETDSNHRKILNDLGNHLANMDPTALGNFQKYVKGRSSLISTKLNYPPIFSKLGIRLLTFFKV